MDMRIAGCVMKNPIRDHALGRDVQRYELPDKLDILLR
ncbi:Uncharacterised protein [Mycobacterium tuberculosis]|nr:Uncharacterised protein [Mycobacterium tuberculosis]